MKTKAKSNTLGKCHRNTIHSIQASVILFLYCFQLFVAPWFPSFIPQPNSPKASQPFSLTSYPANPLTASIPKYVLKNSWNSDAVGQLNESIGNLKNPLQKMGAYDENAAAVRDGAETFVGVVDLGEGAATLAKNAPKILSKTEDIIKAINQVYQDSSLSGKSGGIFPKGVKLAPEVDNVVAGSNLKHVNGSIAEEHGWHTAIKNGQIPIKPPTKVTSPSVAYATYDPIKRQIIISDAKYRSPDVSYPSTMPESKVTAWTEEVRQTVNSMEDSALKKELLNALDYGRVKPNIFKWPQ